jgi:hypothetical protein
LPFAARRQRAHVVVIVVNRTNGIRQSDEKQEGTDMRTPRLAGLGLATMATVALAVAGCDNGTATSPSSTGSASPAGTPSAAGSSSADPAAVSALSGAAAKLDDTSFKVTVTSGSGFKLTGGIDAPNGAGTAEVSAAGQNASVTIKTLMIDKDLYVQIPGITKAGTWTHLDSSRLPANASIGLRPGQIDPVNTAGLISNTTDVHATGSNEYAGSLDLTKAAGLAGMDQVTINGYGASAQNVPFTASLDAQGRLSKLTITLPATNGQQVAPIEALYTDYGSPVTVTRPAASEVTEAPDNLYESLGS